MAEVFEEILRLLDEGRAGVLATLVKSRGSVPMSHRAKLLVRDDGTQAGTIGGGCLEADVWQHARRVMRTQIPRLLHFHLNHDAAAETGLTCGGNVDIFVEAIHMEATRNTFARLANIRKEKRKAVLATLISAPEGSPFTEGSHLLIEEGGTCLRDSGISGIEERVQEAARECLREDLSRLLSFNPETLEAIPPGQRLEGAVQVFIDPFQPDPTLFLFGGGHVGYFTAKVARMAGFRVTVIDDREDFANPDRFPDADGFYVAPFEDIVSRLPIDESSYIVIVTRGHKHDGIILERSLKTQARYIGMIGSRRKAKVLFDDLISRGVSPQLLERIRTPVGLDIGADTPEEVSVSIVAEMIQCRREGMHRFNWE